MKRSLPTEDCHVYPHSAIDVLEHISKVGKPSKRAKNYARPSLRSILSAKKTGDAAIFHFGNGGGEEDTTSAFGSFNCWNIAYPHRI